ncbi:MAG: glycoside hydrolase, partial [Chloroflexi bacterium]|nr:glycoside hydrolase [Chloroflexota bacterium]
TALLDEAQRARIALDSVSLGYAFRKTIERLAEQFRAQPTEFPALKRLEATVSLLRSLPFQVDLWKAQNACYEVLKSVYPAFRERAEQGDESARKWKAHFSILGEKLSVLVE